MSAHCESSAGAWIIEHNFDFAREMALVPASGLLRCTTSRPNNARYSPPRELDPCSRYLTANSLSASIR
jgi:hypothetical protein